jgi:TonB family protein
VDGEGHVAETWKQSEGQVVDWQFHLRRYLGGGEHSAVFLTEYGERQPQKAAIKIVPADPRTAGLQLSRWKLAAKLSHPHLLRLFQTGRCRLANVDLLYIVMEYAEEDLSQVMPQRPLTPSEAREMLIPALEALAYVHAQGFVHSHIKPANIMAREDQLKVASDTLCRAGELAAGPATPCLYDPPELGRGPLSPASDVWSLGMTLVEALTQHLPAWDRARQQEPVLPETLPPPFLEIARHCLHLDPLQRWTLADIGAHLGQTLPASQKQPAAPPAKLQRFERPTSHVWLAKRRYVLPAVTAALALAVFLAIPRLLQRSSKVQRTRSGAVAQPTVQPKPQQKPQVVEKRQPAPKIIAAKPPSSAAPLPAPLQPSPVSKPPAGEAVPGKVLQQVLPNVPQKARDTIRGTIRLSVKLDVDAFGNVTEATLDVPGPSKYFARLALEAAQHWQFAPVKVAGQPIPSKWLLRFYLTQADTKVFAVQIVP